MFICLFWNLEKQHIYLTERKRLCPFLGQFSLTLTCYLLVILLESITLTSITKRTQLGIFVSIWYWPWISLWPVCHTDHFSLTLCLSSFFWISFSPQLVKAENRALESISGLGFFQQGIFSWPLSHFACSGGIGRLVGSRCDLWFSTLQIKADWLIYRLEFLEFLNAFYFTTYKPSFLQDLFLEDEVDWHNLHFIPDN